MAINKINLNLAQEIVNAVKEVVDKDINFIDINGIIIGSTDKKRLNYVVKSLTYDDLEDKNDMSLKKTSADLYIHKNTLQYKLEKIQQKCGLNPRNFNDSVILYTAIAIRSSV